jgi:hypothetical protein
MATFLVIAARGTNGGSCPFRGAVRFAKSLNSKDGRVAEWFKAPVLKTGVPARVPWVRIPPLPPRSNANHCFNYNICFISLQTHKPTPE